MQTLRNKLRLKLWMYRMDSRIRKVIHGRNIESMTFSSFSPSQLDQTKNVTYDEDGNVFAFQWRTAEEMQAEFDAQVAVRQSFEDIRNKAFPQNKLANR